MAKYTEKELKARKIVSTVSIATVIILMVFLFMAEYHVIPLPHGSESIVIGSCLLIAFIIAIIVPVFLSSETSLRIQYVIRSIIVMVSTLLVIMLFLG